MYLFDYCKILFSFESLPFSVWEISYFFPLIKLNKKLPFEIPIKLFLNYFFCYLVITIYLRSKNYLCFNFKMDSGRKFDLLYTLWSKVPNTFIVLIKIIGKISLKKTGIVLFYKTSI